MIQLLVDVYGVSPNATASVRAKFIPPLVPHPFLQKSQKQNIIRDLLHAAGRCVCNTFGCFSGTY